MRIVDADILAYALFDESPAHLDSWKIIENAISSSPRDDDNSPSVIGRRRLGITRKHSLRRRASTSHWPHQQNPVVVSNDLHIAKIASKIGLMVENPLPEKTRRRLSSARPGETESDSA